MLNRCVRGLLLVVGIALLVVGFLPVFAVVPVPEGWSTLLIASKLIMLPIGALCLMGAVGLRARYGRR